MPEKLLFLLLVLPVTILQLLQRVLYVFLWCQSTLWKVIWKDLKPRAFCLRHCRKTDGHVFGRSLRGFQGLNPFFLSGWRLVEEPAPVGIWCNQTWLWSSLCELDKRELSAVPDPARTGCAQAGMTNSAKKIKKKKGQASGRKVCGQARDKRRHC